MLVTCLSSPNLDVTLAAMRATSAFIQVCACAASYWPGALVSKRTACPAAKGCCWACASGQIPVHFVTGATDHYRGLLYTLNGCWEVGGRSAAGKPEMLYSQLIVCGWMPFIDRMRCEDPSQNP